MSLRWEKILRGTWRAHLPVYGNVRVESDGVGSWVINASAPGICETLIEGAFTTAEEGMASADAFVADQCRAFINEEDLS